MRGTLTHEQRLQTIVTRLKTSNERLRDEIKALRQELRDKDRRLEILEGKLVDKEQQRKLLLSYLYKPKTDTTAAKPKGGRKPGLAFHRPAPKDNDVTEEQTWSVKQCPMCKHLVGEAVDQVTKYQEDIDLAPRKIIKKYTITRHWCAHCETYVKSKDAPNITRLGLNCLGYILYARYRLRLPVNKIRESLLDLYDFAISEGEIVEKLKEAERLFGKNHAAICELIKQARVVHADETGWRMDGQNWWLWVFLTDQGVRYVIEDTRGKGVAVEALGQKEDRVIISDGYSAYQNLPGDKQQCRVHLIRVAKPASLSLHEDLVKIYVRIGEELTKPLSDRDPPWFEKQLRQLITKAYEEPAAVKVQARMTRHATRLLTCLRYDGVLTENNPAERAIRPQVIMRKIFGGSRSRAGAKAHEVNSSVLETLRKQNPGQSFFDVVLPLLKKRHSEL